MSNDLQAWLAAMPPDDEIEARAFELESELELLRVIKQVRDHSSGKNGAGSSGQESSQADAATVDALRKRMSPERDQILRVILRRPKHRASIPDVVRLVNRDHASVASNMQRMVPASLLERVGYGHYAVTPAAEALMREKVESV